MRFNNVLKTLQAIVDSMLEGTENGKNLYQKMHKMLQSFLSQSEEDVDAQLRLQALTVSLLTFGRLIRNCKPVRSEADNLAQYLFLESAKLFLGTVGDALYQENNDENTSVKARFRSGIKTTRGLVSNWEAGARLFAPLETLIDSRWQDPVLQLIIHGEEIEEDKAMTFVNDTEPEELLKLRIELLLNLGLKEQACNLLKWYLRRPHGQADFPFLLKRFDLLTRLARANEIFEQCREMTCCAALKFLGYAHHNRGLAAEATLLTISQGFVMTEFHKFTDLVCGKELLTKWMVLEHERWLKEPSEFIDACNKMVMIAQDGRQLVDFLLTMESLFGNKFLDPCVEAGLKAIRKERFRLFYAENHSKNEFEKKNCTASLVSALDCLARLFEDHIQLKLSCLLSAFSLLPSAERKSGLELCCSGLTSWPPMLAVAPSTLKSDSSYKELLLAVELLRNKTLYRTRPAGWQSLEPVLQATLQGLGKKCHRIPKVDQPRRWKKIKANGGVGIRHESADDVKPWQLQEIKSPQKIRSPGKRGPRRQSRLSTEQNPSTLATTNSHVFADRSIKVESSERRAVAGSTACTKANDRPSCSTSAQVAEVDLRMSSCVDVGASYCPTDSMPILMNSNGSLNEMDKDDDDKTIVEEDMEECEVCSGDTDFYECNRDARALEMEADTIDDGHQDLIENGLDGCCACNEIEFKPSPLASSDEVSPESQDEQVKAEFRDEPFRVEITPEMAIIDDYNQFASMGETLIPRVEPIEPAQLKYDLQCDTIKIETSPSELADGVDKNVQKTYCSPENSSEVLLRSCDVSLNEPGVTSSGHLLLCDSCPDTTVESEVFSAGLDCTESIPSEREDLESCKEICQDDVNPVICDLLSDEDVCKEQISILSNDSGRSPQFKPLKSLTSEVKTPLVEVPSPTGHLPGLLSGEKSKSLRKCLVVLRNCSVSEQRASTLSGDSSLEAGSSGSSAEWSDVDESSSKLRKCRVKLRRLSSIDVASLPECRVVLEKLVADEVFDASCDSGPARCGSGPSECRNDVSSLLQEGAQESRGCVWTAVSEEKSLDGEENSEHKTTSEMQPSNMEAKDLINNPLQDDAMLASCPWASVSPSGSPRSPSGSCAVSESSECVGDGSLGAGVLDLNEKRLLQVDGSSSEPFQGHSFQRRSDDRESGGKNLANDCLCESAIAQAVGCSAGDVSAEFVIEEKETYDMNTEDDSPMSFAVGNDPSPTCASSDMGTMEVDEEPSLESHQCASTTSVHSVNSESGSDNSATGCSTVVDLSKSRNFNYNQPREDHLINVAYLSPPRTSVYLCVHCGTSYKSYSIYTYHRKVCANSPTAVAVRLSFPDVVDETSHNHSSPTSSTVASKTSAVPDAQRVADRCTMPSSSYRVCGRAAAAVRRRHAVAAREMESGPCTRAEQPSKTSTQRGPSCYSEPMSSTMSTRRKSRPSGSRVIIL